MDNLESLLTNLINQAELSRSAAEKPVLDGANKLQSGSGNQQSYKDIPLTDKTKIPSLLTRAKLSPQTRLLEERRLASIENL